MILHSFRLFLQPAESQDKKEKLIEHQPAAGFGQGIPVRGKMDLRYRVIDLSRCSSGRYSGSRLRSSNNWLTALMTILLVSPVVSG